jgi:hypothetical protein
VEPPDANTQHIPLDDGTVSRRHARLEEVDGIWWVQDLGSANGTRLSDALVKRAALVPGNLLGLGRVSARLVQREVGGDEGALRAGLDRRGGLEVYADWLDGQGRSLEAAWVRQTLRLRAADPSEREPERQALEQMADHVGDAFRARLAFAPIERCPERCGQSWEDLPADEEHPHARRCARCAIAVRFCDNLLEAQRLVERGARSPLVVEPSRKRAPDDLLPLSAGR